MASRARLGVVISLMLPACSVTPDSGQFLCSEDGRCPTGMRCVAGLCVGMEHGSDAGMDGPTSDAPADVFAEDTADLLPPDAQPFPVERCAHDGVSGASLDEDEDGIVDESCSWHVGTPHLIPRASLGRNRTFSVWVNPSGSRMYVVTGIAGDPIYQVDRPDIGAPFDGPLVEVSGTRPAAADPPYYIVSLTADERILAVQSGLNTLLFGRSDPNFAAERTPQLDIMGYGHATLSADGLEMYVSARPGVGRLLRGARDMPFGAVMAMPNSDLLTKPSLAPDGATLFAEHADGRLRYMARLSRADAFDAAAMEPMPPALDGLTRPHWVAASRELWLTGVVAGTDDRGVFRAQACRGAPCEPETEVECDTANGAVLSSDRFHCYWLETMRSTWRQHHSGCVERGGYLATITSESENQLVTTIGDGRRHIGLNRGLVPACSPIFPCEFRWVHGEPTLISHPWSIDEDDESLGCAQAIEVNRWSAWPCSFEAAALCERDQLPRWLP